MSRQIPPALDQFEISVFGPGRGECVVVHLGNNEWCVVDSCLDRVTRLPVAVEYLSALGKDALTGVKLVVATHWHDDHVKGLAQLFEKTPNAAFVCSSAMSSEQFLELMQTSIDSGQDETGVDEFSSILSQLLARDGETPRSLVSPRLATQNRVLLRMDRGTAELDVEISSLSPSDGTHKKALSHFASLIPTAGSPMQRLAQQRENDTSVVLWLRLGTENVLLGADLEHTNREGEGWLAVLGSERPPERASVYKIPHHGSTNGDHDAIWTDLLKSDPVSVVTPFSSSGLPRSSDLVRLRGRTANLYATSMRTRAVARRDNSVERELRGKNIRSLEGDSGHVRIRWMAAEGSQAIVELFNGASRIQ